MQQFEWLAKILLFSLLILTGPSASAFAQDPQLPPIDLPGLIAAVEAGETVEWRRLQGDDLVTLLKQTDDPIKLTGCVIEGGLELKRIRNAGEDPALDKKRRYSARINNDLSIVDCEIRPRRAASRREEDMASLWAEEVLFAGKVDFSGTSFVGPVNLARAVFTENTTFERAEFRAEAVFRDAAFAWLPPTPEKQADLVVRDRRTLFTDSKFHAGANFIAARFDGETRFGDSMFVGEAIFAGAEFGRTPTNDDRISVGQMGWTSLRRVRFEGVVSFVGATLHGSADFEGAHFADDAVMYARFERWAQFVDAKFMKGAFFKNRHDPGGAEFRSIAVFDGAHFDGHTTFSDIHFEDAAFFREAVFAEYAEFQGVAFDGNTSFIKASFLGKVEFIAAEFGGLVHFGWTRFEADADFSESRFSGDRASFASARFWKPTSFSSVVFDAEADFRAAFFAAPVDFWGVQFARLADFQGASVLELRLDQASFGPYSDFRDAEITSLSLNNTHNPRVLEGRFDFRGARIDNCLIEDVVFLDPVDFSGAAFGHGGEIAITIFRFVTFDGGVSFAEASFAGSLALIRVKVNGEADFTDARFDDVEGPEGPGLLLSHLDIKDSLVRWDQLPKRSRWVGPGDLRNWWNRHMAPQADERFTLTIPPARQKNAEPLSRVFQRLEENFRSRKLLSNANGAYLAHKLALLDEQRACRADAKACLAGDSPDGFAWAEVEWWLWGNINGYGTQIWRVIYWILAIDLLFALVYAFSVRLERAVRPSAERDHAFKLRVLDMPGQYFKPAPAVTEEERETHYVPTGFSKFLAALRLSTVILLKVGPRDTMIVGEVPAWVRVLQIVEWALGFYLLAALVVTLANTQPLLNKLITGVF